MHLVNLSMHKFVLKCKKRNEINLLQFAKDIIKTLRLFRCRQIKVFKQYITFAWPQAVLSKGMRVEIGKRLAKIKGLGCYCDVYEYMRSNNTPAISRQLFKSV